VFGHREVQGTLKHHRMTAVSSPVLTQQEVLPTAQEVLPLQDEGGSAGGAVPGQVGPHGAGLSGRTAFGGVVVRLRRLSSSRARTMFQR
jgi:hypothetical protein